MTFRTKLLSSACLIALSTGAVQAQGLSAPNTGWNGAYVGGLVGAGFQTSRLTDVNGNFGPNGSVYSPYATGVAFGLYGGYNWQFSPTTLLGVEADITYNTASGSALTFSNPVTVNAKAQFAGSLRVRAGFVVDRALFYVTGGLAVGNPSISVGPPGLTWARQNSLRVGYVLGLGTEYQVTRSWTVRFEGLYYDFGTSRADDLVGVGYNFPTRSSQFQARVGASYRF
ncbi:outer membrane protein [Phreatobacter oligotrophus]|uniref:outer membrane protein n=1 Tax=Phreatobacter oligotrophus TaxID=1122261 RepID=UPI0023528AB9|nr:outer membrane beta-barrel protein [Phreatobacter oligotrophus]MBX9991454.1 outer membrane beta-barrel protein [Phreatobacter oligotrophus]